MSVIDWVLLVLIIILLLTLISFSIYSSIAPNSYTYMNPIHGKLNVETTLRDPTVRNFIKGSEGSLSVFLYLHPTQRTPTFQTVAKEVRDESLAEIADQLGINNTIFRINNYFMLKQFPAGRDGTTDKAELRIITKNTSTTANKQRIEVFPFAPIPKQQWTYVTITRVGRRFSVYYNTNLVTSFRTASYPIMTDTDAWNIGDPSNKTSGFFAYPLGANIAYTDKDIQVNSRKVSDTRNKPILPKPSIFNIFSMFGGCPNGIFCFSATDAPSNGLNAWSTPFA